MTAAMEPVDSSQPDNASAPVDASQVVDNNVTASGLTPADNATPPQHQDSQAGLPQDAAGGPAVAGVDDEPKGDYDAELAEFLTGKPTEPAPQATPPAPQAKAPEVEEDDLQPGKQPTFNRIRTVDEVDVQALAAWKAAQKSGTTKGQSFVQFVAKFAPAPVETSPTAEPADNLTGAPATTPPQTVAEVDAQLKALRKQRYEASENFDWDKAREIEDQEETLRLMREDIRVSEATQQQQQQTAAQAADETALTKVAAMFPQAVDASSEIAVKADAIFKQWQADGNPLASQPNRFFHAYVEAAAALNVAPSSAPISVQRTSTPTPANRPPVSAILASGGARDNNPRPPVSSSTDDYEAEVARFLATSGPRKAA